MRHDAVSVLVQRDGLSLEEAKEQVAQALDECMEAIASGDLDPEEIWMDLLGLEPDYLYELII